MRAGEKKIHTNSVILGLVLISSKAHRARTADIGTVKNHLCNFDTDVLYFFSSGMHQTNYIAQN